MRLTFIPLLFLFTALTAIGCNPDALLYDRAALLERTQGECRVGVPGPACIYVSDDNAAYERVFNRFVDRMPRAQYDCLLDERCFAEGDDPEEADELTDDYIDECFNAFLDGDEDCLADCLSDVEDCDAGDDCADADVDACLADYDECTARC